VNRISTLLSVAAIAAALCLPAPASAVNIYSKDILPADGKTGQTITTGTGVKTGHIQNGAVTDAKISGTISTSKLNVGTTAGTVAAGDHTHNALYQSKYANVIVVAKSGGDFTDPVAAVASISNPSATNRYLVRIQPGVYDLGRTVIVMKNWVDIEGAGENSTVLTGFGAAAGQFYTLVATASNSTLRSLTLQGTGTVGAVANPFLHMINNFALSGTPTGASNLDRVTLVGIGDGVSDISAVAYSGFADDFLIRDVTVRISGSGNGTNALTLYGNADGQKPTATVRGLDARIIGGQAATGLNVGANIRVDLSDSRIQVVDASIINVGIFTSAAEARITNVTAETQGAGGQALHAYSEANYSWNPTTYVDRSTLISGASPYGALRNTSQRVFAAMTKVVGPIVNDGWNGTPVTRCVGMYNENYQSITCP
jgi:hypothetical protein